jgi:tetratricopeptide (TPR) repeat protein
MTQDDFTQQVFALLDDNPTEAILVATEGLNAYPQCLSLFRLRAIAHANVKDDRKAIEDLSQYLAINSDDATVYEYRGIINRKLDLWNDAIEDFTRAIEIEPISKYYFERGQTFVTMGNIARAKEDLQSAIEINSPDGNYYCELASQLLKTL